jgi:hypothetical protein
MGSSIAHDRQPLHFETIRDSTRSGDHIYYLEEYFMRPARSFLVAAALLVGAGTARAQQKPAIDSLALARQYTLWFYAGMADSLIAHSNPEGSQKPTVQEIQSQADEIAARAGNEVQVIEEKFVRRNGRTQYWRTAKFDHFDEPLLLRWVISPAGYIDGFGFGPLSQAPPIDPPSQ